MHTQYTMLTTFSPSPFGGVRHSPSPSPPRPSPCPSRRVRLSPSRAAAAASQVRLRASGGGVCGRRGGQGRQREWRERRGHHQRHLPLRAALLRARVSGAAALGRGRLDVCCPRRATATLSDTGCAMCSMPCACVCVCAAACA